MNFFSFNLLKNVSGTRLPKIGRDELLVWGVLALIIFLAVLIIWDAYLFYSTLQESRRRSEIAVPSGGVLAKDLAEALRILDERQAKLEPLLKR